MVLSDKQIKQLILEQDMISPVEASTKGISSGVSSYGFDAKLGNKLFLFDERINSTTVLDPKCFAGKTDGAYKVLEDEQSFIIPPYAFALGKTKEYFKIPENVFVICVGKSSYARCGLIVNVTPLEPGWEGYVTLEFSNTNPYPVKMYVNEGICQFIFFQGNEKCEVSYKTKQGKYMYQQDITLAKE